MGDIRQVTGSIRRVLFLLVSGCLTSLRLHFVVKLPNRRSGIFQFPFGSALPTISLRVFRPSAFPAGGRREGGWENPSKKLDQTTKQSTICPPQLLVLRETGKFADPPLRRRISAGPKTRTTVRTGQMVGGEWFENSAAVAALRECAFSRFISTESPTSSESRRRNVPIFQGASQEISSGLTCQCRATNHAHRTAPI